MRRVVSLPAVIVGLLLTGVVQADDQQDAPSITVQGVGEVQVRPDVANVTIGVTTEAANAADAVKENNLRMAELLKTLRARDIADKHLRTSNFRVSPRHSVDRTGQRPPKIVGYTVTNQVNVTVIELSRLGAILDAAVSAGSNEIQGISFTLADSGPHLDQARRKAFEDASHRANLYAEVARVKLGKPRFIREQAASIPRPVMMMGATLRSTAAEVPIATGEQTVSANVTVTFDIDE